MGSCLHGYILCMSAVVQANDYNSFNLLAVAVGPDTENYTKAFLSHFFSVCLTHVSLSLSLSRTRSLSLFHSLYLKLYHPPLTTNFRVAQTLYASPWQRPSTLRERDSSAKTSIRPGNDIVQTKLVQRLQGPEIVWNTVRSLEFDWHAYRTANTTTQKQLLYLPIKYA